MRPFVLAVLALTFLAIPSHGLEKETVEMGGATLVVQRHTLENGLTLLLAENHRAPTIGVCSAFRVGSVDEWDGVSGVTHILEHMLFKGSDRIGTSNYEEERVLLDRIEEVRRRIRAEEQSGDYPDEEKLASLRKEWDRLRRNAKDYVIPQHFQSIVAEQGGRGLNAFTSYDATAYIVRLPANRLELWLLLESERLGSPVLREFYTEVQNIREERRMRVEDNPVGKLWENSLAVAYQAHRYGTGIIGWDSDIRTIDRAEVEEYFRIHYAPNRMIVCIVGDIEPEETVEMVEAYFGDIEPQPDPRPVETVEPPQEGERRLAVEFDAEPWLFIGFHKPTLGHPDNPALTVAEVILNRGRSSRLQKNIVAKKIARSIASSVERPGERYPNLFYLGVEVQSPYTAQDAEAAVYEELDRLKWDPVSDQELERARNIVETEYVRQFADNLDCSITLAYDEAVLGSWMNRTAEIISCGSVTAEEVARVAQTYFTKRNRTVGSLVKPEGEEDGAARLLRRNR